MSTESSDEHRQRPCLVAFDLVFLNGECIITQPWYVRRKLLTSILKPKKGYLQVVDVTHGTTVDDIVNTLDKLIADKYGQPYAFRWIQGAARN